ncbi:transposase IS4 family protein, partial [Ruminiclostridium papyrosolvens DSM 2782]
EKQQQSYIKPQTYKIWKKKSFKKDISKRENMKYDEDKDEYTCHNGKQLKMSGTTHRKSATGYRSEISIYECEDCSNCPYKSKCTKAQGNRKMQVSKTFVKKRQKSYENILTEKGILLRVNRSIQVEGAFGVLKSDYNFKRFLTRGRTSVKTEFMLLCFGYNINKLHSKIQNDRCGKELHEIKAC